MAAAKPSWSDLPGVQDAIDPAFLGDFQNLLLGMAPGASDQAVSDAIKKAGWYGKLGSGSNPYNAAIDVAQRLGFNVASDSKLADQWNETAVRRSPEQWARDHDDNGFLGLGDLGLPLIAGLAALTLQPELLAAFGPEAAALEGLELGGAGVGMAGADAAGGLGALGAGAGGDYGASLMMGLDGATGALPAGLSEAALAGYAPEASNAITNYLTSLGKQGLTKGAVAAIKGKNPIDAALSVFNPESLATGYLTGAANSAISPEISSGLSSAGLSKDVVSKLTPILSNAAITGVRGGHVDLLGQLENLGINMGADTVLSGLDIDKTLRPYAKQAGLSAIRKKPIDRIFTDMLNQEINKNVNKVANSALNEGYKALPSSLKWPEKA